MTLDRFSLSENQIYYKNSILNAFGDRLALYSFVCGKINACPIWILLLLIGKN